MNSDDIRRKFLKFFEARGHKVVPSSSLIPDDPSVLLTTAGMQQFKEYFTGELDPMKDFGAKSTTSVQKCFRTSDIDEVGDERHLTFFEMLGNFSFGGYFKKEAIQYGYDFIVKEMGLTIDYVTVFEGEPGVPADTESEQIWKTIDPKIAVKKFSRADNFWGPTGTEGPCGPTTEIYVDGIEIWNIVFNQYYSKKQLTKNNEQEETLTPLKTPGIDTGMGLERLAKVSQEVPTVFETDLFRSIFRAIYDSQVVREMIPKEEIERRKKTYRIIADHFRASIFLIGDGVMPSNTDRGYILRRMLRRAIWHAWTGGVSGLDHPIYERILDATEETYGNFYPQIKARRKEILTIVKNEWERFKETYHYGSKAFDDLERRLQSQGITVISGKDAFDLHQSRGFTIDILKDFAKEHGFSVDENAFHQEFKKHQEISRAGKEAKFGGHGLYLKTGEVTVKDESELAKVTRLHTATHLMHAGLRAVLGPEVKQNGSDITIERTRFDFSFPRKVTPEELKQVEAWVNGAVAKDLKVEWREMTYEEAVKDGALGFFKQKYPPRVKVYTMFDPKTKEVYSKEFCGGPHVEHTGTVGVFKILKEESSSAGVRRIRGVVEP